MPDKTQLLQIGNTTVHAHVEGTGPDLILIHGASGSTGLAAVHVAKLLGATVIATGPESVTQLAVVGRFTLPFRLVRLFHQVGRRRDGRCSRRY